MPGAGVRFVDVADDVRLRVQVAGSGPPVVLLHGHPRVTCPTLVLWSASGLMQGPAASVRGVGGRRVLPLRGGQAIDSGHHVAEDAPEQLAAALVPFLAE